MAERTDDRQNVAVEQPKSDTIRRGIESTRASLDEKLEALEYRVRQVQSKAKQVVDLGLQARRHPWWIFGAAVALGFATGVLTGGRRRSEPRRLALSDPRMATSHPSLEVQAPMRVEVADTIKLAARAAISDLARQALIRTIPVIVQHLNDAWQSKREQTHGGFAPEIGKNGSDQTEGH